LKNRGKQLLPQKNRVLLNSLLHTTSAVLSATDTAHSIPQEILTAVHYCALNLHISYLPCNRGADLNIRCFVEAPRGVSIHRIDEGIDTGDILVQKRVYFPVNSSLCERYNILQGEIQHLFKQNRNKIKTGHSIPKNKRDLALFTKRKTVRKSYCTRGGTPLVLRSGSDNLQEYFVCCVISDGERSSYTP
jgi:methionyl-tRNA formyltransferase